MTGQILGRADELRQVFAFLADDTPGARAVVLLGEAGIGKTTIWRTGVRHAEELGLRALVAQPAESEAGLPYAALADLFATVTDDALDRLPPQQRAALGAALARTAQAGPLDPHALARATVELLAGAASDGRLLVAIDDVQWLDAPTAAALAFGLRRLESASLLVLVSMRTETGGRPDSPLGLESWVQRPRQIAVGPLAPTELGPSCARHSAMTCHGPGSSCSRARRGATRCSRSSSRANRPRARPPRHRSRRLSRRASASSCPPDRRP